MPAPNDFSWSHLDDVRDWQMTAPYLRPHASDREPWGTFHLKLEGSLVTACGESAVAWPVFWGREFHAASTAACQKCAHVLRLSREPELASA